MATKDMKIKLLADHAAKIAEVNEACAKGTNAQVEGKLVELSNIEQEYRKLTEKEVFASLADVREALVKHHFETISHKKLSEEGRMVGVEKVDKPVQVDLKRFCEYKSLPIDWFYELQALNKRLTLKVAIGIGMKPDQVREISGSYQMDKLAEEIELGKTPDSNSQCIKHMQKVLDMLCPDCGKVNNYDLAYVMAGYTKRSNRASLKVVCSRHNVLQSLLTDAFHNVVTGVGYGVEYKRKPSAEKASEDATKAVSATDGKTGKASKQKDPAQKGPKRRGSKQQKGSDPAAEKAEEMVVVEKTAA